MRVVKPKYSSGNNLTLLQLFGKGPKHKICCGECGCMFEKRLTPDVNFEKIMCPHCNTINEMPFIWSNND